MILSSPAAANISTLPPYSAVFAFHGISTGRAFYDRVDMKRRLTKGPLCNGFSPGPPPNELAPFTGHGAFHG
jgi:hypothetical protein